MAVSCVATKLLFMFLLVSCIFISTIKATEDDEDTIYGDECDYEIVVSTGKSKGPTNYKLSVVLTTKNGENISTSDFVGEWGDMGRYHTFFQADSESGFMATGPCFTTSFCNIEIGGGNGSNGGGRLKPHWYINNITVITRGDKINDRTRTFHFFGMHHNIARTNPPVSYGNCRKSHKKNQKKKKH
ncbi:hypothetical protein MKW94_003049 [Papaver nudicaule]|uniref:PLAT domain-containing protein n=1 Tax=Papaver nudicaule TaxID=74823 RepID=A0AA41VWY1_PAPNU|nr:hypothetical protein [Papaver nudicaule]MCL7049041.1 hypothetical protein [Papaver nudicaule]